MRADRSSALVDEKRRAKTFDNATCARGRSIRDTFPALSLMLCALVTALCWANSVHASGILWELDASFGYLFVSEAQGTPWFSGTEFPTVAVGAGGNAWALGVSADYADNADSFEGGVPGSADTTERVDRTLSNTLLKVFARLFPGGRGGIIAPYLGIGVGPAITRVQYEGKSTGTQSSDYSVRLCYTVSVGSKLRLGKSPFSAFVEGSFGGLGGLPDADVEAVSVPREELNYISVAAGLGVAF